MVDDGSTVAPTIQNRGVFRELVLLAVVCELQFDPVFGVEL
jgi:hypothetical protein